MHTWIQGINASTVCTTRAHGSARATMYSQSDAHSIECGTTYSTCVHSTKLDTACTRPHRRWYQPRYQLRNSHTRYRLRYRLHANHPEPVSWVIPCMQHMHMVPGLTSPAAHSLEGVSHAALRYQLYAIWPQLVPVTVPCTHRLECYAPARLHHLGGKHALCER